ncbi:FAD-dependent monooxygenase [Halobacillus kuroshimensis]|uniref:FAD-dependent monooxygenase n=1 Tax=Halobacillus kuroshimensis TaxID=302481 RepID=A0ABS3DXW1_9BACI|nr:NAD(P)/FAD-dependent oxidoreductase [Halobacillus kuroshimensis]MBN8236155.1 FAD-dependent monooxygenase [Halobacillus kuroshimensis]
MNHTYDVIITGARAAGASLAVLLGKMGKRVLLIDKAAFPSDTLSTHFMSHTRFLEELGILHKLEETGLRKVSRMRTYIGQSFMEGPRADYTIIPKRDVLDPLLIEQAEGLNSVTFMPRTSARGLIREDGRVTGLHLETEGKTWEAYAAWVAGADGKNSNIAAWTGAEKYRETKPLRPVLYGYYTGVEPLSEPVTEIFLHEGRIGFVFPMEENRDCLGIEIHPGEFADMMKAPQETFEQTFNQFYGMKKRMEGAVLQGKIIGTPGMPNFFRNAYGEGWVLLGDAGHSKDPSTGLGINDAFLQSFLLADAFQQMDEGVDWETSLDRFQSRRDEQLLPGFQLTLDYIQSLRKWTDNEMALFQTIAANPMAWNKLMPHMGRHLKEDTKDFPLFYQSVEGEASSFGFRKD